MVKLLAGCENSSFLSCIHAWAEASARAIGLSAVAAAAVGDNAVSGNASDIECWGDSRLCVIIFGAKAEIREAETG